VSGVYLPWREDEKIFDAINDLINEIRRTPFTGTGKPEALKGTWQGWWSRRITKEDRLVYGVQGKDEEQRVTIAKCRNHY
jgi:toxin YoeB